MTDTFTPTTEAEIAVWTTGLRSKKYEQGMGRLRRIEQIGLATKVGYCCLGAKCVIEGFDLDTAIPGTAGLFWADSGGLSSLPSDIPAPIQGLSATTRSTLAELNDGQSYDFEAIADVLDEHSAHLAAGGSIQFDYASETVVALPIPKPLAA